MPSTNRKLIAVVCILASFLGGAAANLLVGDRNHLVLAQDEPSKFKVISANRFMLLDSQGRACAALTVSKKHDTPMLMFLDENQTLRMTFTLGTNGDPTIAMLSSDKKQSIALNVEGDGSGKLEFAGQDGVVAGSWKVVKVDGTQKWKTILNTTQIEKGE